MGRQVGAKLWGNGIYPDSRSQSEVVAVVLILGLVLLGAFVIVGLGVGAIGGTESQLSDDRAEKVLTQIDSKASLVALDRADSQEIAFPSDGGDAFSVDEDAGWLKIEVTNRTTGDPSPWALPSLVNVSLGALVYENGDTRMAYQGGGVFRSGGERGTMVSPPEFHFRDATLTLPIVNVTGEYVSRNSARISHSGEDRVFPLVNQPNPLDDHEVEITVQGEFYEGWGHYFEERTDGEVDYDDDDQTATLVLKTPIGEQVVENAISGTSSDGDFRLAGSGAGPTVIADSYNSSVGTYSATQSDDGNITVAGDFELTGNHKEVRGNIETGGHFECGNNIEVTGNVFYDTADISCDIDGDDDDTGDVQGEEPINDFVNDTVADVKASNDNTGTPAEGNEIDYSGSTATLEAGDYYLEELKVGDGETLFLDTQGTTLRIGVENYAELDGTATIEVLGDGKVEIHIRGEETNQKNNHFDMTAGDNDFGTITTSGPRENSTNFWIYGKDDMIAELDENQGNGHFEGVIYAPTGLQGDSQVDIRGFEIFGGIVAGHVDVDQGQGGAIHFDRTLENEQAIPEDTKVVTITYLHITENTIRID